MLKLDYKEVLTKESIIEKTSVLKISPAPSLPKRGIPPFCKACLPAGRGGKEGFNLWGPYNYGLISIFGST